MTKYYLIISKTAVDCAELAADIVDVFAIAAKLLFWWVVMGSHGMRPRNVDGQSPRSLNSRAGLR